MMTTTGDLADALSRADHYPRRQNYLVPEDDRDAYRDRVILAAEVRRLGDALTGAEDERDDAQAEVEKLRAQLHTAQIALGEMEVPF
jgi:multidrug resistance efflux pump